MPLDMASVPRHAGKDRREKDKLPKPRSFSIPMAQPMQMMEIHHGL